MNNARYLLDVDSNQLAVNDHTILERDHAVSSEISFQLLNPDRVNRIVFQNPQMLTADNILKKLQNRELVTGTSYIRFYFPFGSEEGDFIDGERGKLIRFETESSDWSVAQGIVEERHISFVISCYNQKVIQTLFSVYFKCKNIQSYAPLGMTYVYAEIKNVAGIDDVIKVFPIQKRQAIPRIERFFSQPTTTGGNSSVHLDWKVSGAKEGHLTPGDKDIFRLPAPSFDVEVNRNLEYRLSIKGNALESAASVNLYVRPPYIALLNYDATARRVSWQTKYSDAVQLSVGERHMTVEENGELEITMPDKPQVVVRANGWLYTEYAALNLQGLTFEKPMLFRSCIRVYPQYTYTRWDWKTGDTIKVEFGFTEDRSVWHTASTLSTGSFEYLSDQPLLGAKLVCTRDDGSVYPVLLLDGEVV